MASEYETVTQHLHYAQASSTRVGREFRLLGLGFLLLGLLPGFLAHCTVQATMDIRSSESQMQPAMKAQFVP